MADAKPPPRISHRLAAETAAERNRDSMNVFDILGPVMIGPSSSHTAGAARIGLITRRLLGTEPVKADILLHGSFARTYRGHGTDKALIAGILGFETDDIRIRNAPEIAEERGIKVTFTTGEIPDAHPNTARITLTDADGHTVTLTGSSIGGGNILITELNGLSVRITGERITLIVLHRDRPGIIAAVTEILASEGVNICNFRLSREEPGGEAVMTIEIDGSFGEALNARIAALPDIYSSTMLQPI